MNLFSISNLDFKIFIVVEMAGVEPASKDEDE